MRGGRLRVWLAAGAALGCLAAAGPSADGAGQGAVAPVLPPLAGRAPAATGARLEALATRFDERAAFDLVTFMDQYWRNAGNAGFNATVDRIRARLEDGGFRTRSGGPAGAPTVHVEEYGSAPGWDHTVGTLTLLGEAGEADEVLLSRERHRVALCINSFSTPPGGTVARIIDVGDASTEAGVAAFDVRGAVVLGNAGAGRLWQLAVVRQGAIGVVSTALEDYIRPGPSEADARTPREDWDVLQWSGIPYDETRKSFGFKATPRAAARLRARLARGEARVRVEVASTFAHQPVRTLVAEIPGRTRPDERIVLVAHIQEPGANDNASGCATLLELARALVAGIRDGSLPAPERTLTLLWVDEIRGSRQWLTDHAAEGRQVRYMLSLDMTGEDTAKTGGTFLIEKAPDPSAVWPRPSDPHTEWGGGPSVKAETLKGTLLNDLFLAICQRRAATTGWVVRTNPYEGGSDHAVFLAAGVPSALAWHFPDRFYHSSLDRPVMTDPAVMQHVGVSVGATALILAGASAGEAGEVVDLLEAAADARLDLETIQGRTLVAAAADKAAAAGVETLVRDAWVRWYHEALDEASRLPVGEAPGLRARIEAAQARIGDRPGGTGTELR